MKNRKFLWWLVIGMTMIVSGCATAYKPVDLPASFWEQRSVTIGVAMFALPTPQQYKVGNQGLLDIAINNSLASPVEKRLSELDMARVKAIPGNLAAQLQARGFAAKVINSIPDRKILPDFNGSASTEGFAKKDYRSLNNLGVQRLLVVDVTQVGTIRAYYGFIPIGAPKATFTARAQLIDLADNRILWDKLIVTNRPLPDPWDQAPDYPNLSGAVVVNYTQGAAELEHAFFNLSHTASNDEDELTVAVSGKPKAKNATPVTLVSAPVAAPTSAAPPVAAQPLAVAPAPVQLEAQVPVKSAMPLSLQTSAATGSAVSTQVTLVEFTPGVSSATVERLAKQLGCDGRGAGLITPKGPIEMYRMACHDGRTILAKCELRQCNLQ